MSVPGRLQVRVATSALALVSVACGGGGAAPGTGALVVERDTVGDTVVVRTVSGSAWGARAHLVPEISIGELDGDAEYLFGQIASLDVGPDGTIYVVDRQGPELRAYGPDGSYKATIGRPGEGPGELGQPDGGLAVLSDGRILVRDPGNARIQVYAPSGEGLATWPHRGGFFTSSPLFRDRDDNVYTQVNVNPQADFAERIMGLARYAPDGTVGDTILPPSAGFETPRLEARMVTERGRRISITSVPFSPSEEWTLLSDGTFAHGVSTSYRITLHRPDAPLTIERAVDPIPVTTGERAEEERRVRRGMTNTQPDWSWNGPATPDAKPAFRALVAARDGRLWVTVPQPGVEQDDPDHDPTDPNSLEDRWQEPVVYDVFEADGTYLGHVHAPKGFRTGPIPVFDGDLVWAVTTDELGVQRVVRFRIRRGDETRP